MASEDEIEKALPSNFCILSNVRDYATSVRKSTAGQLPDPGKKTGGDFTNAFLDVVAKDGDSGTLGDPSWSSVLNGIKSNLNAKGITDQSPHLSSTRPMSNMDKATMHIVPQECKGTKRALLIGINYTGIEENELSGCHKAVEDMKNYLIKNEGFVDNDVTMLVDDNNNNKNRSPTKKNIHQAFLKLIARSKSGDVAFIHFAGQGGSRKFSDDGSGGSFIDTILPVDFQSHGHLTGHLITENLIAPMKKDVTCMFLMDCCNSSRVGVVNMPYNTNADFSSMIVQKYYVLPKKKSRFILLKQHDVIWDIEICLGACFGFCMITACVQCCGECCTVNCTEVNSC